MGIEADAREQPWGIVPATAPMVNMTPDGAVIWPPQGGTIAPPITGGSNHAQIMSRVSLGF